MHRPVLPHILDALELAPTTLVTGEFLVAHLTADGEVHALERHRPAGLSRRRRQPGEFGRDYAVKFTGLSVQQGSSAVHGPAILDA